MIAMGKSAGLSFGTLVFLARPLHQGEGGKQASDTTDLSDAVRACQNLQKVRLTEGLFELAVPSLRQVRRCVEPAQVKYS